MTVFNNIPAAFVGTQSVTKAYFNGNVVYNKIVGEYMPINATGGAETYFISEGKTYKVHTFTSDGTLNVTDLGESDGEIEYLIVAGGGSGGGNIGGGGGAGGVLSGITTLSIGEMSVTVGEGGTLGNNGENSVFNTLTAIGGGAGDESLGTSASNGGSGGGAAILLEGENLLGGLGTPGQGNDGGDGFNGGFGDNVGAAGGGGGASSKGLNGSTNTAGNGGNGIVNNITGSSVTYAGGGGGATFSTSIEGSGGIGGSGGGGNGYTGTSYPVNGEDGVDGLGGGGGGGSRGEALGGSGGSGTVIVKYLWSNTENLPPEPPTPTEPIELNVTDLSVFTHYSQRDGLVSYPNEEPPRVLLAPDPFQDEGGVVVTSAIVNDWDILTIETDALLNNGYYDVNPYFVMGIGQNDFQTNNYLNITNTTYGANESVITGSTAPHSNALFVAANLDRNDEVLRFGGGGFTTQDYITIVPAKAWKTYKVVFTRDSTVETTITCDFYVDNSLINSFTATGALDKTTSSHLFLTGRMNSSVRNMKYLAE